VALLHEDHKEGGFAGATAIRRDDESYHQISGQDLDAGTKLSDLEYLSFTSPFKMEQLEDGQQLSVRHKVFCSIDDPRYFGAATRCLSKMENHGGVTPALLPCPEP
jgi:hypothetical protein